MFSPGVKRSNLSSRKSRPAGDVLTDSPVTPLGSLADDRRHSVPETSVPNRPATGTPAPWASRLSTLARILPTKEGEKADSVYPIRPVFVGEYPQIVRDEQAIFLQKHVSGDACSSGGMDKETCLAWMVCGNKLFIWCYLSPAPSKKCVALTLPSIILECSKTALGSCHTSTWMLCVVNWEAEQKGQQKAARQCNSYGVILCNRKTQALAYWPDIYVENVAAPFISLASANESADVKSPSNKSQQRNRAGSSLVGSYYFNSLIASATSDVQNVCVALACSSNGELWQFRCSSMGIQRKKAYHCMTSLSSQGNDGKEHPACKGYPRSLTWHFPCCSPDEPKRSFLLLTDREIQCFTLNLSSDIHVLKLWSHEIIGSDGDLGIQKDLAGQKRIWPLDMQVDTHGKVITVLIATFCKDRVSSSSYILYSLLTMQYKTSANRVNNTNECIESTQDVVLEKKTPVQVVIPKARLEDEDFLFSMRLRVGGKPSGSTIVLSVDGSATVSHYWRDSTRLYQFDLPYDAGKVLDASIFPLSDNAEEGAWVVLTEKAGMWVIPENAVLLGGVEPPDRSLSRKGSVNEVPMLGDPVLVGNLAPKRTSSEAWNVGDRQRAGFHIVHRAAQDEESEALLSNLFNNFLISGKVDGALSKLQNCGAFARDGETNVFTRISKSIVDTLAKHWTTARGVEILALSALSLQLKEKQQKHEKFLQFLALSKCHEELRTQQRQSLQFIMEHGEKLASMIQLRELQSTISEACLTADGSCISENQALSALWDLIQLAGEKIRRNTVLLMDRDNSEVFYSKVSDLPDAFDCLDKHLDCLINEKMSFSIRLQRICGLSNACVTVIRAAIHYRNEHHLWYPLPGGLTMWYCHYVVRSGLWSVASFMLQLLNDSHHLDESAKLGSYLHLEELADVLLEVHSIAIRAKVERGEDHKSLLDEYCKKRDLVLDSIYQQVEGFYKAQYEDSMERISQHSDEILGKLSSDLLSIAKRHGSYQTLWKICCELNDSQLLRNLMRESLGPKGGFRCFVFNKLYESKQLSQLMRLGEEFQEELASFLKPLPELHWLQQVFLHQFSSASQTLHVLALSQDDNLVLDPELVDVHKKTSSSVTLADRKRLLNLSKVAAMAERNSDYDLRMKRIDADLKIMKLQEEILEHLPDNEKQEIGQRLLPSPDLIELCLKAQERELSLRVFDVFAWTSSSFRKCNANLLEECWRNAADQDDWERIYERFINEGWGDEDTIQVLKETILFQASRRCYGAEAETFEGGFDEVLLLRQEKQGDSNSKDVLPSVESILMGHKTFPDAGKLMLMAIVSGSVEIDTSMEYSFSPMV